VSIVTVLNSPERLQLELQPSPEMLRTVDVDVFFYPSGGTLMRAAVYFGTTIGASAGFHPLTVRSNHDRRAHWQLRPGLLAALVVGSTSIPITECEFSELREVPVPLGD